MGSATPEPPAMDGTSEIVSFSPAVVLSLPR